MIARLPFVERPDHPAGMPVFVIRHRWRTAARATSCSRRFRARPLAAGFPSALAGIGGEIDRRRPPTAWGSAC